MTESRRTKVVVWGGSAVGTPALVNELRHCLLPQEKLDVVLVGRTASRLVQ